MSGYSQTNTTGHTISSATYTLDSLGRATEEAITYNDTGNAASPPITHTLKRSRDADGHTTAFTWPDGSTQSATYHQGQLQSITTPDGQTITYSQYQWMAPTRIDYLGAQRNIQYDPLMRPIQISVATTNTPAATLMSRGYQYDAAGNITQRNTEDGLWQYGYDKLNRLTRVTPPDALTTTNTLPEEQYAYDTVGNRTASLHQPGAWQYNQDNQLLQWGTDSDLTALTWTAAGQTHTQSWAGQTRTHHYDATQRLVQVNDDSANLASYRYDPLGRRISKTVNGQTTWYLYSEEGMIAELDNQGRITKGYGWQPDTSYGTAPLWQAEASSTNQLSTATLHYLHTDHLGTPQMATDREGHQTWKGHSEAFGKTTPDPTSLITMNLRFPGQYLDQETGTHYNYFRDYSPNTGRYIQADPIGLEGGVNLYGYVGGKPLLFEDPFGLWELNVNECTIESWYGHGLDMPPGRIDQIARSERHLLDKLGIPSNVTNQECSAAEVFGCNTGRFVRIQSPVQGAENPRNSMPPSDVTIRLMKERAKNHAKEVLCKDQKCCKKCKTITLIFINKTGVLSRWINQKGSEAETREPFECEECNGCP